MRKTISILFALALVLSFSLVAATPVAAADITVGPDPGYDHATIQDAVDAAVGGETIIVAAGTYAGNINVNKSNLTIVGSVPASGRGAGPAAPVIDGNNQPGSGFVIQAHGITIKGFVIRDFGTGPANSDRGHGIFAYNPGKNNITIQNNTIDNTNWVAVFAFTDDGTVHTNWDVSRNVVSNVDFYSIEYTNVHDSVIADNYVDAGGGEIGILVSSQHGGASVSDIQVLGNEVFGASVVWGLGMLLYKNTAGHFRNITVECNTIRDGAIYGGIAVWDAVGSHDNIRINRNAIFDNASGLTVWSGVVVDATDNWWGSDSGPFHSTNPTGTGNPVSNNVLFSPWIKKAVATTATGTGPVSFSPSAGNVQGLTPVAAPSLPSVTFPHGMFSFQICCLTSGQTVDLTVTLPSAVPVGTVWWKYDNGQWSSLPNLSDNGDNIMVIRLTDGAVGDSDGVADGFITDPGGPGNPMTVGWDGSPASKAAVVMPWIALLAAIVAGAGLFVWKRRRVEI